MVTGSFDPGSTTISIVSGKTFYLETFGCQMNVHDSEKVAGTLLERGYTRVETPEEAGLVLYNTCSIRDKAEQKVYNRLRNFKRSGNGKLFGVLGCVAQQEGGKIFDRAPHVSLVCGSASYPRLGGMLAQLEAGERRVTGLSLDTEETFDTPFTRRDSPHRAYITISEGCDKSCAYCVVPFTRGRERSRTAASVMDEARRLAEAGSTEIQLLGQNVNSYRDPSPEGWDFAALLSRVAAFAGIRRVRFTTSHPRDFSKSIVEAMEANPAICDHVHLPVQSGSSSVLAAMQRGYTRDDYMRRIEWLKSARRRYSISTDIIVGFPGETEAGLPADAGPAGRRWSSIRCSASSTRRAPTRRRSALPAMHSGRGEATPPGDAAGDAARHTDPPQRRLDRRQAGGPGGGTEPGAGAVDRAHVGQSHAEFRAPRKRRGIAGGAVPGGARHAQRAELLGG